MDGKRSTGDTGQIARYGFCPISILSRGKVLMRCWTESYIGEQGYREPQFTKKYPVHLGYHILDRDGNMLPFDGERTPIWEEIGPGVKKRMRMRLTLPGELARREDFVCRITLVAEGGFWFDQEGGNKKDVVIHLK